MRISCISKLISFSNTYLLCREGLIRALYKWTECVNWETSFRVQKSGLKASWKADTRGIVGSEMVLFLALSSGSMTLNNCEIYRGVLIICILFCTYIIYQ